MSELDDGTRPGDAPAGTADDGDPAGASAGGVNVVPGAVSDGSVTLWTAPAPGGCGLPCGTPVAGARPFVPWPPGPNCEPLGGRLDGSSDSSATSQRAALLNMRVQGQAAGNPDFPCPFFSAMQPPRGLCLDWACPHSGQGPPAAVRRGGKPRDFSFSAPRGIAGPRNRSFTCCGSGTPAAGSRPARDTDIAITQPQTGVEWVGGLA